MTYTPDYELLGMAQTANQSKKDRIKRLEGIADCLARRVITLSSHIESLQRAALVTRGFIINAKLEKEFPLGYVTRNTEELQLLQKAQDSHCAPCGKKTTEYLTSRGYTLIRYDTRNQWEIWAKLPKEEKPAKRGKK